MGPRQLAGTVRAALALRHQLGRVLVAKDLIGFLRLSWLATASQSGLAAALTRPGTAAEVAERAGFSDVELTRSVLDLGVGLRQVRRRGDRYHPRGRRLRAVAAAPDVSGLAEEATRFDAPIYVGLTDHLRGAPQAPYDAELGELIARVSRVAEPAVGPWLASAAEAAGGSRVLDVGCGSGVNLRWLAKGLPGATDLLGVDLSPDAVASAEANLRTWGLDGRATVRQADLEALPADVTASPWDVVLLANNLYYWPVAERSEVLRTIHGLLAPGGALLLVIAVPGRNPVGRNLDVCLRVTTGCDRLPTMPELRTHATEAGFTDVTVTSMLPGADLAALVARRS